MGINQEAGLWEEEATLTDVSQPRIRESGAERRELWLRVEGLPPAPMADAARVSANEA